MWAALRGRLEVVRYLLDKGAGMDHLSRWGESALAYASATGHVAVMSLLLDRGADVSIRSGDGFTPLMKTSNRGHLELVQVLLRRGGDHSIDANDKYLRTALYWASYRGYDTVVRVLLEAGADPSLAALQVAGRPLPVRTPLQVAMFHSKQSCVKLLQDWEVVYRVIKARRLKDAVSKILTCFAANDACSPEGAKQKRLMAAAQFLKGRVAGVRELAVVERLEGRETEGAEEREELRGLVVGHILNEMKPDLVVELGSISV